jgi:protein TonB
VVPKEPAFPAPMNFSFGKPQSASPTIARPRSSPHIPGTIDMSLGPASRGAADPTPFSEHDEDAAGADWRNALSQWVSEHAYYPEQAAHELQEGDAKVHVIAAPNGRVKEVQLIGKSGSMWLDMALVSLFRDRQIPPLPSGMEGPIEFNFTMHYVLIRPR